MKTVYNAFNMPVKRGCLTYPEGPYRFINREYMVITYETDEEALRAVLPNCLSTVHFITDLTLPYGKVMEDFLK